MDLLLIVNAVFLAGIAAWIGFDQLKQRRLMRGVEIGDINLGADIDAVREKPFAFQLCGKIHVIKPMSVTEFVEVTEALAHLDSLKVRKCTKEELLDAYEGLFRKACPSVSRTMIESINAAQVAALLDAIIQFMVGKAHIEAQKKSQNSGEKQAHA